MEKVYAAWAACGLCHREALPLRNFIPTLPEALIYLRALMPRASLAVTLLSGVLPPQARSSPLHPWIGPGPS